MSCKEQCLGTYSFLMAKSLNILELTRGGIGTVPVSQSVCLSVCLSASRSVCLSVSVCVCRVAGGRRRYRRMPCPEAAGLVSAPFS